MHRAHGRESQSGAKQESQFLSVHFFRLTQKQIRRLNKVFTV